MAIIAESDGKQGSILVSRFEEALRSGKFLVTAELNPPKGVDVQEVLEKGEMLKGLVDAVNITDSQSAIMCSSSLSLAHLLLERGLEPILQLTCRDRNSIALQADLLSAHILGIENILCLRGDPPTAGDHPDAKPVFELDAVGLLRAASTLMSGRDLSGKPLKGAPRFCLGAALNPGAPDPAREIRRMEEKVEAGASFFQTQAVFEPPVFRGFMERTRHLNAPVLAGVIILKSERMARHINERLPGVHIPEELIREMEEAEDKAGKGIQIAARIIREIRGACRGVHIMAIGWERYIPRLLEEAGLC